MKKNTYTLISLSILTALYSAESTADLAKQCLYGVPHFTGEVVSGNPNDLPVYIEADQAEITQPRSGIYKGVWMLNKAIAIYNLRKLRCNNREAVIMCSVTRLPVADLIIETTKSICWAMMPKFI